MNQLPGPGDIVHVDDVNTAAIVAVHPHPPSASRFAEEFDIYQAIQVAIDKRLKNHIMEIQGKPFRKKAYWRALAVAFNLHVEPVVDEFFQIGSVETMDADWGYRITYKASTTTGRAAYGDGACMRSEKLVYDYEWKNKGRGKRLGVNKEKTADNATHHNVRGHAHTRAHNRAVSNLVGFGEVSAEEVPHDFDGVAPQTPPNPVARGSNQAPAASGAPWDGNLPVTFGKYKAGAKEGGEEGKKWNEIPGGYLEYLLSHSTNETIKDMVAKEVGRRAKAESSVAQPPNTSPSEDLPFDGPPTPEDDDRYGHGA
jgi:hypothetical protein